MLIPVTDFFRNPEKTGHKILPDGKYVRRLAEFENRLNISIQSIAPSEIEYMDPLTTAAPLFYFDRIKAMIFVHQSTMDLRVNKSASDQLIHALRNTRIAVEYLVKENVGIAFNNQKNKFEFYKATEQFLNTHFLENKTNENA